MVRDENRISWFCCIAYVGANLALGAITSFPNIWWGAGLTNWCVRREVIPVALKRKSIAAEEEEDDDEEKRGGNAQEDGNNIPLRHGSRDNDIPN